MIRTTHCPVNPEAISFDALRQRYRLLAYRFPTFFKFKSADKNLYVKLIAEYKRTLDYPFYFFTHDKPASFYVLVPHDEPEVPALKLHALNEAEATPAVLDFEDFRAADRLPVLVKLLLAEYFWTASERERRICQPAFFTHALAPPTAKSTWHTVVEIDLHEARPVPGQLPEFNLVPHARHFQLVDKTKLDTQTESHFLLNPYYEKVSLDRVYFRQLRTDRVLSCPNEIWQPVSTRNRKKPAQLPWFNYRDATGQTKGRIAFELQERFVAHLNDRLGAGVARAKTYTPPATFKSKIVPSASLAPSGLPIRWLRTVYVLDNRLRDADGTLLHAKAAGERAWTLADAVRTFNDAFRPAYGVTFAALDRTELHPDFDGVVLVLQDVRADDFVKEDEETGQEAWQFLGEAGFTDPKPALYRSFPNVAKQSLTVNPTPTRTRSGEERFQAAHYLAYFDYARPEAENLRHEMAVCLNELFLKKLLLRGGEITDPAVNLPGFSSANYPGGGAERLRACAWMHDAVFLSVENRRFAFAELSTPEGKRQRRGWLAERGLAWDELENRLLEDVPEKDQERNLRQRHFVFGPGYALEIKDTEERVLFPYDPARPTQTRSKTTTAGMVGIGYLPAEQKYFVGSAEGMRSTEERAVHLRQLEFWQGQPPHLDDLLETLAARFVRNGQHTVYPYPFDLIRLWAELFRPDF